MARWYYAAAGQQYGPIELAQAQSLVAGGQIRPDTFVWQEGTPQWIAAPQAPELFPSAGGTQTLTATAMSDDPGPFWSFGKLFSRKGSGQWAGRVIATPSAIYLLKIRRNHSHAGAHAGLVGVMIASALTSEDDLRTCSASELPPTIHTQLDPKGKFGQRDVIILPRTAISLVRQSFWKGFVVTCGEDTFTLSPRFLKRGATRQFLTSNGWKVNQPMQPTTIPIHGAGFNRPASAPPKKRMGVPARVGLIILAVIILILVVIARMASEH